MFGDHSLRRVVKKVEPKDKQRHISGYTYCVCVSFFLYIFLYFNIKAMFGRDDNAGKVCPSYRIQGRGQFALRQVKNGSGYE